MINIGKIKAILADIQRDIYKSNSVSMSRDTSFDTRKLTKSIVRINNILNIDISVK